MKLLKKIRKDNVLFFIIGAILFGGIGVAVATGIASSSIDYTTNENNDVETVEDALNDLYAKAGTIVDSKKFISEGAKSGNGYIYYHNPNLINSANDGSLRYAGADPNNYICFGSDASTCPASNIYRIIGIIPVDVVTDETDSDNPVIERQSLYKVIKNDYETETTLGMTKVGNAAKTSSYSGPIGNQPSGNVDGFYWKGTLTDNYNTWSLSTLNTTGLNINAYGTFTSTWQDKIAKVMWKVGGNTYENIRSATPMSIVYKNEIINPVTTRSQDNRIELANKIGLMYTSDYGYAAPQSSWTTALGSYNSSLIIANNWLYKGTNEWTITRNATYSNSIFAVNYTGTMYSTGLGASISVRRVFYLTENTTIDMGTHAGTLADPYRVS